MAKKKVAAKVEKETKVKKIVNQVKEPLSLLETLKEEGMARAMFLMGAATGAAKQVNKDKIFSQFKDALHLAGVVTRTDLEALEERIEVLEAQIAELTDACCDDSGECCGGGCDKNVHDEDE